MRNLYVLICLVLFSSGVVAQCDWNISPESCKSELGMEFTYLKSRELKTYAKGKTKSFEAVFNKGDQYMFITCNNDPSASDFVLTVYDKNRAKLLSNYNFQTEKYYSKVIFTCKRTGKYVLEFQYVGGETGCGICSYGFKPLAVKKQFTKKKTTY